MRESIFLKLDSLKEHDHICYLHSNNVEGLEIGTYFITHSVIEKERCFYVSDRPTPKELIYRLKGSGIGIDRTKYFEEISITDNQRERMEKPHSLAHFLKSIVELALTDGKKVRILKNIVGLPYNYTLLREAFLDKLCSEKPIILMCQYDLESINSQDAVQLFKTHPIIVHENTVYDSSFYTPPDKILSKAKAKSGDYAPLTSKEKIILRYIVNGYDKRNIAKELSISEKTVEKHRTNIMKKLDIHKLAGLVKFAIRDRVA